MESNNSSVSTHRGGRLVVCRFGSDAIRAANQAMEDGLRQRVALSRAGSPPPLFTDAASVQDWEGKALHVIRVRRLDYRPPGASAVGNVAVFSEPAYAPFRTARLQLATPAYYRQRSDLAPGIGDARDGTLTKDGSRWANTGLPAPAEATASITFAASREPWVYCGSHYRFHRELRRLKGHFAEKHGYTAATEIRDPSAFAMWLGIDFALNLNKTTDVKLEIRAGTRLWVQQLQSTLWPDRSSRSDTIVDDYHGPVHYEDHSGDIATQEDWLDLHGGPRAWFTKRTSLASQSEYRFAVSTLGAPVEPRQYIDVSEELRALTSAL